MSQNTEKTIKSVYSAVIVIVTAVLMLAFVLQLSLICIDYLGSGEDFYTPQTVLSGFLALLPYLIVWLAVVAFGVVLYSRYPSGRESEYVRGLRIKTSPIEQVLRCGKFILCMRIAMLTLSALFICLGIANGGARELLVKAINICTECIGLG